MLVTEHAIDAVASRVLDLLCTGQYPSPLPWQIVTGATNTTAYLGATLSSMQSSIDALNQVNQEQNDTINDLQSNAAMTLDVAMTYVSHNFTFFFFPSMINVVHVSRKRATIMPCCIIRLS